MSSALESVASNHALRESINLVVTADVCEDRAILGSELKDNPDIVFNGETPILLKVAGKFVRA